MAFCAIGVTAIAVALAIQKPLFLAELAESLKLELCPQGAWYVTEDNTISSSSIEFVYNLGHGRKRHYGDGTTDVASTRIAVAVIRYFH